MEMKAGSKQTDIGIIPEDWDCVPSSEVAAFFGGNAFKGDAAVGHGVKWLKIANVGKQRVLWDAPSFLPIAYVNDFEDYVLYAGDVVMALTRPILDDELKIAKLSKEDAPALLNQRVAKVIASSRADIDFIYHVLQTRFFVASMKDAMAGSDPPNIGSKTLGGILVAVPGSLQEQRAISTALSDVDALIAGLEKLIAKKRDLKQAAMQQLLTGQTRLPGFSGEWTVKRFGEVAALRNGYMFRSETYLSTGNYKVITIANVQDGYMAAEFCNVVGAPPKDIQPHQELKIGDILISMTGNVGRVCRVSEDNCLLNQRVGKLVPMAIDGDYLFAVLCSPSFTESMIGTAKGGAQPNLSAMDINEYEFRMPMNIAEQAAIATVITDINAELSALEFRQAKIREIKQGMMQDLLTGRTRLL
jgi:type I restriction enzyme, S subunit